MFSINIYLHSIAYRITPVILFSIICFAVLFAPEQTNACSRIFWNNNGVSHFVARTLDWDHPLNDLLIVYPRGIKMDGGVKDHPYQWTSKYGSVVESVMGNPAKGFTIQDGGSEGMNEVGLSAHYLYLETTKYPESGKLPGVSNMRWVRYILDNFATVNEALEGMKHVQIVPVKTSEGEIGIHLSIEDRAGDSAIIEYINGKLVIHHGKQFTIMTNDPPYDWQIANLKKYKTFGGDLPLPGNILGSDRFVRAAYFLKFLPKPKDDNQGVAYLMSVIRNVAVPFGAPYGGRTGADVYPTWWITVMDLDNLMYYFNWTQYPNIIWIDVKKIDFSENTPIRTLNLQNPLLTGDSTEFFKPVVAAIGSTTTDNEYKNHISMGRIQMPSAIR